MGMREKQHACIYTKNRTVLYISRAGQVKKNMSTILVPRSHPQEGEKPVWCSLSHSFGPCRFCSTLSYMILGDYHDVIFSNLSHMHMYTNIGGQCKSHVQSQTCNLIGSPTVKSAKRNGSTSARPSPPSGWGLGMRLYQYSRVGHVKKPYQSQTAS